MKEKIEITKSELVELLVEKINVLSKEYKSLHSAFKYDKDKVKVTTDPIIATESYQRFLYEYGEIKQILKLYDLFKQNELKNKEE